ncbi:MAG: hypothetical protein ABJL44_02585 [Algibacter sp.]
MNFKNLFSLLLITTLLFNCSSSSDDDEETMQNPDPTGLTYDDDIKSIITGNCTQCHGSPTTQGAPTSFTTYNQVKASVDLIISRINSTSNPMPPSGQIASGLRSTIEQWKTDGLLEN